MTGNDVLSAMIAGATAGAIVALTLAAHRYGATVDNMLNCAGGALGAGLAVSATQWLEYRRARGRLKSFGDALLGMLSAFYVTRQNDPEVIVGGLRTIRQYLMNLERFAVQWPLDDALVSSRVMQLLDWCREDVPLFAEYLAKIPRGEIDKVMLHRQLAPKLAQYEIMVADMIRGHRIWPRSVRDTLTVMEAKRPPLPEV